VRFILDDNSFFDIDTFALTYKFPYKSAEIFLKTNDITRVNLQDFIILGDKLYFYNLGPTLLREYDMSSSELREILHFGSGDHIAGQSSRHITIKADVKNFINISSVWLFPLWLWI